jgi:hypothetical protein
VRLEDHLCKAIAERTINTNYVTLVPYWDAVAIDSAADNLSFDAICRFDKCLIPGNREDWIGIAFVVNGGATNASGFAGSCDNTVATQRSQERLVPDRCSPARVGSCGFVRISPRACWCA